ncbi:hypothetical protein VNO80_15687 [Phaseolus coccineus]|uniref:Uncharacterized protein n=1 Tax=Phaseolus coccineus TaxID=3886 RepID=A0AAN9MKP6_PHACN
MENCPYWRSSVEEDLAFEKRFKKIGIGARSLEAEGVGATEASKALLRTSGFRKESEQLSWGRVSEYDAISEKGGGRECLDSMVSDSDGGNGGREGEEMMVQSSMVQAKHILGMAQQKRGIKSALNSLMGIGEELEVGTFNVEYGMASQNHGSFFVLESQKEVEGA